MAAATSAPAVGDADQVLDTGTGPVQTGESPVRSRPVLTDDGAVIETTFHGPTGRSGVHVLVHGWGARGEAWDGVVARLVRAGRTVMTVDLRGHGRSTLGTEPITIDRLGADLATVLTATGLTGAVVVGHSGGGYALLSCLTTHAGRIDPSAVAAIALVATASHGQKVPLPERKLMGSRLLDRLAGRPGIGRRLLAHTCGPDADPVVVDRARHLFATTPAGVRGACFASTTGFDLRVPVAGLSVPALVLCGSEDGVIDPDYSRQLAELLPNGGLCVVEGVGHMLPLEAPDAVADALLGLC